MNAISWERCIGRLAVSLNYRPKHKLWGRFGAGWNWKLGIEIGGRSAIIYLLIFSIGIAIIKKGDKP